MFYESYRPKNKKRQQPARDRRSGCSTVAIRVFLKLLAAALMLVILSAAALYAIPVSAFLVERGESDLALTDGLPTGAIHVLLIGTDVESEGMTRSDTMLIASVSYSGVKLTSLLRDTMVEIPGHGRGKLNSAYAYGGAELLMRTINQNYSLNINRYIRTDYVALVDAVNAMGGVNVDITEAEMEQININIKSSGKVFRPLGYTPVELKKYGEGTLLDGLQALGYARIRKLDSDFVRASRQRVLLSAMLTRLKSQPYRAFALLGVLGKLETNLSALEMASLGMKAAFTGKIQQLRLPVDGSYNDDGSSLNVTDFAANTQAFLEFAY